MDGVLRLLAALLENRKATERFQLLETGDKAA